MNNLNDYYDEIVDLIYQIPLSADGWQPFIRRINVILKASSVHVLGIDLEKDAFSFSNCSGLLSDERLTISEMQYLRYPIAEDPRMVAFLKNERLGWYQCQQDVSEEDVQNSSLYQNILLPIDMRYTSIRDIIRDEKLCVLMGINTSKERGILTKNELEFLDRLFIHLKRIVLLQRKLFEFSTNAIVGFELINKLSQPIMLINLSGKIVHYNDSVKNILKKIKLSKLKMINYHYLVHLIKN